MLHHAWRAVSGALRMRRSRECRKQGHVKASLEVASGATTDLVALGWLTCPDRVDKDALACATRAYRAGNRDVCNTFDGVGGRLLHPFTPPRVRSSQSDCLRLPGSCRASKQ